ncbi:TIGR03279 family radical SAM protein [Umezakia ovalisporum]|jgi:putative radical SAM enzyme (TIGR03279 family)|uniref:TIGR03279 family radical SAM protein n=1 Tax=Umezakia ovalisporum FSS-62 TaxID=2971776 RepID=A0AA43GYS4_9CYAN|nr:TIGR03279 family radical SAM protein [Umezakia ovalisporum]MBI1243239.1 TIGR03279 family radical SAM protein [Nostoc sp. RI_552]MDH6063983.1 TIGR03279 family radical SAM protein [Umezakia ovalisporum FSS-62]MDH6067746.1 TIGR03279 family radical SAM protein [Umezakia ovalisporum APH033B]MDH6073479.1 TIGR03279 family radical SAM protein [Umezakia ovalisporum CS-1034]MDH6083586.1 TIGR03279 family radical SAM protein [Umezakia ovalisporum TAC611]
MSTIHPAQITKVLPDSIAAEIGFEPGDAIVAINGTKPRDLIDYQFLCADEFLELEVLDTAGKTHHIEIEKDYDEDLGLEFATALFDALIQCNNRCPFCFIDQQPPGKRFSLYLKDDDYRLSFLYGSYLTLTNLSAREWERIEQMRLSPLFVSIHATEPEIRIRLLKNQRAGQILQQIKWFQDRRLQIHAQVVLCPGINDGQHLEQTLKDLASFHCGEVPAVASVAVVPVGLTRFRPQEDELIPVTREKAQEVISQVKTISQEFRQKFGSGFAWLADEWFLIAGEELPGEAEYEEYPQIDNGVGSIRLFIKQFTSIASELLPAKLNYPKKLTWVVGNAVEKAFQPIVQRLNVVAGLQVNMEALYSDYWGQNITVTGLITGHDLLFHLQGKDLGDGILLPKVMLKHGELVFLDDMSVAEVAQKLKTEIFPVAGIEELINTCISEVFIA